jgi:uncharacterized cupredoxin-like copper-binding protein
MRQSSQRRRHRDLLLGLPPLVVTVVIVVAVLSGCSGRAATGSGFPVLRVSERDFRIKAPKVVRAGELRLRVRNQGPDTHELIVTRVGKGRLPIRTDGLTVDEDTLESVTAVTVEGFERGATREVRVHLLPGRYVLFCNMAGHYLSGMHATVIVR